MSRSVAPAARTRNDTEGDEADAAELARSHESLTAFLHRQALSLRLSEVDTAALRFLIESLNDDGYLEEPLEELAISLAGPDDLEQIEELVHRFTVAQRLLQSLEPVGVGARNLAECLTLQLTALACELIVAAWAAFGLPDDPGVKGPAVAFAHGLFWLAALLTLVTGAQYWEQTRKALQD